MSHDAQSALAPDGDRVAELLQQFQPQSIPYERRVFANRNLRMSAVELIGFDMDYTLAQYHQEVERLAIRLTIQSLVRSYGYPPEIAAFEYDPGFAIIGLTVDKRYGNLLKMDNHRHISRVFHGLRKVEKPERRELYRQERLRMSAQRFALIDTLFAVPEAWLFARLVEFFERERGQVLGPEDYERTYDDIRKAIDTVHADDSLKDVIRADLTTYIDRDPELPATLHRFRVAGKRLFLMTNSYAPYTQAVMSYLLDGADPRYPTWRDYFDIVVVGSRKPLFFIAEEPFVELDDAWRPKDVTVTALIPGRVYLGGNIKDFEAMAGSSGDGILYVGDNMYGDILRSKKATTWRTAMVVPDMERELQLRALHGADFARRNELETHRTQIDTELHSQQTLLDALSDYRAHNTLAPAEVEAFQEAIAISRKSVRRLERSLKKCLASIWEVNSRLDEVFNPNWGMLFKCQVEHSLYGGQVEDYACVYTSRVTNFAAYSPFQYFRTPRDLLPHEHLV